MTDFDDWLYAATIRDLEGRLGSRKRYDRLMIAALLRKLISDRGDSLINAVNRERRLRIRFRLPAYTPRPPTQQDDGLYRHTLLAFASAEQWTNGQTGTRDQLLRSTVGEFEGNSVSVLELIRYFSHVEGGVHAGVPKPRFELAMRTFLDVRTTEAISWVDALVPLGASVLEGLTELTQAVGERADEDTVHTSPVAAYFASRDTRVQIDWSSLPNVPITDARLR